MTDPHAPIVHLRQYAAVGQFDASFEWCCWRLRHYSCAILQAKGLSDFNLAEIIFNQRVFTAEPLFSCFASIATHATSCDKEILGKIVHLRKRFNAMVKQRNDLLHGTYMRSEERRVGKECVDPCKSRGA